MTTTIVRTIPRADSSHIGRLGAYGVATVREVLAQRGVVWRD